MILVVAGAVVNVAVAWACALWLDPFRSDAEHAHEVAQVDLGIPLERETLWTGVDWQVIRWSRPGVLVIASQRSRGVFGRSPWLKPTDTPPIALCPSWSDLQTPSEAFQSSAADSDSRFLVASGWPRLSMWCELESQRGISPYGTDVTGINGGVELPLPPRKITSRHDVPRSIPLHPVPLPTILNIMFYAAVLWIVMAGFFALRCVARRRRGLCPKCAYPMGESATCTECGKRLPQRAVV